MQTNIEAKQSNSSFISLRCTSKSWRRRVDSNDIVSCKASRVLGTLDLFSGSVGGSSTAAAATPLMLLLQQKNPNWSICFCSSLSEAPSSSFLKKSFICRRYLLLIEADKIQEPKSFLMEGPGCVIFFSFSFSKQVLSLIVNICLRSVSQMKKELSTFHFKISSFTFCRLCGGSQKRHSNGKTLACLIGNRLI